MPLLVIAADATTIYCNQGHFVIIIAAADIHDGQDYYLRREIYQLFLVTMFKAVGAHISTACLRQTVVQAAGFENTTVELWKTHLPRLFRTRL